jgi:hypothetical protein
LNCSNNQLTTLDINNLTTLWQLYCSNNQLTSLYIVNGIYESLDINNNPNLQFICADVGQLQNVQQLATFYGYVNCVISSICNLKTEKINETEHISLFPNPVKNSLNITDKNDVAISSMSIYNTLGQLVQVITNPTNTIDVSELKTGNYFVKIVSDKGTSGSKFIKE